MTQYLPPNLLALFAPRDPIQYLPPVDKLPHEKKCNTYTGIGAYVNLFEDPKDTPPPTRIETKEERLERKRREKAEMAAYKLEQEIAMWDPSNNPSSTSDAFKTLFVARINYDTSESKLRREFEVYGTIRRITMAQNTQNGKPRGYAFIEYEHERDMHAAYKHADGKKIDGRRILVDVERGRTVKGWLPRRLGGGLGGTRRGGADVNTKYSGREDGGRTEERADRDRDRDRERRKSKSRSREREVRKRRSRSRSRDRRRERERKPHRSRSRERDRAERGDRDRERERPDREERAEGDNDKEAPEESAEGVQPESEDVKPPRELGRDRKRSRSRDRDRDRRRRRSRSRSRDRRRRDRDRDRERGRGDRDRERDRKRERDDVHVKQEKEGEDGGFANGKPDPDAPYTNNPEDFVGYIKTEPMDDTYNGEDY